MKLEHHEYYSMKQLEKILHMTGPTIKKEIEAGKLIAHKMGARLKFRDDNVQKYIDSCEGK